MGAHSKALLLDVAQKAVVEGNHNIPLRLDSIGGVAKGMRATQVSIAMGACVGEAPLGVASPHLLKVAAGCHFL